MDHSILLEWEFWSTLIALIALLLSQFPPLHELFKRPQLAMLLPDIAVLFNEYGQLNVSLFVDIENAGGKIATVARVVALVEDPNARILQLPGRTFPIQNAPFNPQLGLLEAQLGTIVLKPGENWSNMVRFFDLRADHDQAAFHALMEDARAHLSDFEQKISQEIESGGAPVSVPGLSPELQQRATLFFDASRRVVFGVKPPRYLGRLRSRDLTLVQHRPTPQQNLALWWRRPDS